MDPEVVWEQANPAGVVETIVNMLQHPAPPPSRFVVWNFSVGSGVLKPGHRTGLVGVALMLQATTNNILIHGSASNSGTPDRNQQLSLMRAEAVANYLVSQGVPRSRIRVLASGARVKANLLRVDPDPPATGPGTSG